METDIIAAVATFRAFSSRASAPSLTAPILPPSREDRMATTLVCEGPLMLSKLATNEITYLQVYNFTRAIMPRSRIWRVSETEIVIPATSSNFWLITLKGSPQAIERFTRIISGLCKYERFYERDESPNEYEENIEEEECSSTCSDYSFGEPAPDAESQHVIDARQIIKKSNMSLRLNAVSSKNAHDKQHQSKFSEDSMESLFSFQEWPPDTFSPVSQISECPSALVHNEGSTSSTLCGGVSSDNNDSHSLLESVDPPAPLKQSNTDEMPSIIEPNTPQTSDKPTNVLESKSVSLEDETADVSTNFTSPTAFLLSPPATPLATEAIRPPETPQKNNQSYRAPVLKAMNIAEIVSDRVATNIAIQDELTFDELLDSCEFSGTKPSKVSTPNNKISTVSESTAIYSSQLVTSPESSTSYEEPNINKKSAIDARYAPRFLHPLIPASHVSRYYPQFNQAGGLQPPIVKEDHSIIVPPTIPRRALGRRELLTIGPNIFHPEVTTVGGYIGLMAVKGLLRKT